MPTRLNIYGQAISTTKKRPCIVATTANIVLSGASTPTSIDGVNIGVDDRILVWQQNSPQDNGIYRLETSQLLSRDYDFNISDDLYAGIEVLVLSGLTYSGKTFYLTTLGDLTIGSSSLTFDILAGQNGTSGTSGGTGSSGASGSSGTSGTEGTSGSSGTSGTEGTSGSSGSSGTSGTEGTSGSSGTSGTEGTSGSSGSSGTSGTSGSSGSSGTSGGTGSSGASGSSGTSGTSGLGSSGTSAFIVSSASTPSPVNLDSSCYWYDTTNKLPMVSYYGFGNINSWSAGGALITARHLLAGAGTQNEALVAGGLTNTNISCTEEYDGTSWSVGGALIIARGYLAGAGTQNAGLVAGGLNSGFAIVGCTEEYDGTSWSVSNPLITSRYSLAGAGTQNVGLVAGGHVSNASVSCTEEYDGIFWSAGGTLIIARSRLAGVGTQNVGLVAGGYVSNAGVSCTEEYNGTSWSAGGALAIAKYFPAGAGTQNEALVIGGYGPTNAALSCTEQYNGTSWSAASALITARGSLAGAGLQSAAFAAGGYVSNARVSCTEEYSNFGLINSTGAGTSGSSGTSATSGSSGTSGGGSSGTSATSGSSGTSATSGSSGTSATSGSSGTSATSGSSGTSGGTGSSGASGSSGTSGLGSSGTSAFIVSSASTPSPVNSDSSCYWFDTTNKLPMVSYYTPGSISTWSTGGALITARHSLAGSGTQNAGLAFGGNSNGVRFTCTEEYNGTSWTAGGTLITARDQLAGAGTQNEGLAMGGMTGLWPGCACTEEYNGTSWAAGGALITARHFLAGAGTQNAGLAMGGFSNSNLSCTEEYNGTSWSAGGAMIIGRSALAGAGTQNEGLAIGGGFYDSSTEEYNGTSWSAGGALITARTYLAGAGTQNAGLAFGGYNGSSQSCTESYNGTSWSAGGAMIIARRLLAGAGLQSAAFAAGGNQSSSIGVSCTENYSNLVLVNSTGVGVPYGTINYVPKYTGTTAIGISQIFDNGTSVGIGTNASNGAGKLTIHNTTAFDTTSFAANQDNLFLTSATIAGLGVFGSSIGFARTNNVDRRIASITAVQGTASANQVGLAFFTHPTVGGTDSIVEAMRIDYNGNVGIGTTSSNIGGVNRALTLNAATSTNASYELSVNNILQGSLYTNISDASVRLANFNSGDLVFLTGAGSIERMRIASTGAATFSSTVTCTTLTETSSIKIKENVKTLDNPLDIIKRLRGVEYNRIGETYNEIGVIAEEVNDVLPQVVNKDEEGNPTSVSYGRLTALLIEVVKKQNEQIENLIKRIEQLEK